MNLTMLNNAIEDSNKSLGVRKESGNIAGL